MPKATFFNLPKEKENKILEAAIDEFTKYSYENASVNRIVESADIAKGSFYQYFVDKKDLYRYIIEEVEKKRKTYILEPIQNQTITNFFDSLKDIFLAEIKFAMELPKLAAIALDFKNIRDIELKNEILRGNFDTTSIFEDLILRGIDNMNIDDSAEPKLNTYLLESLNTSILEYYIYEANLDYEKTNDYINNIINLMKDGIKSKKKNKKNFEDRFY